MIDETVVLGILRGAIAAIEQLAQTPNGAPQKPTTSVVNGMRIDDRDLDGPYGNPVIKAKDPRDWVGLSMKGHTLSECTPDYLFLLASRYDYFAEKAEQDSAVTNSGKPLAPYHRKDATRCRGWAQRILNGWKAPAVDGGMPDASEIFGTPGDDIDSPF